MAAKSKEYPYGAIQTEAEIKKLLSRAKKGDKVVVFSWTPRASPILAKFILTGGLVHGMLYVEPLDPSVYDHNNTSKQADGALPGGTARIRLSWRNIPWTANKDNNGYMFENYWHAYAHMLKVEKNGKT